MSEEFINEFIEYFNKHIGVSKAYFKEEFKIIETDLEISLIKNGVEKIMTTSGDKKRSRERFIINTIVSGVYLINENNIKK